MALPNDSIPIESSTAISADDEPISELTASPAAETPPSPEHENTTSCGYDVYRCPDTSTNKPISKLSESPEAGPPPSLEHDNTKSRGYNMYRYPDTITDKSISELSVSSAAEPPPSPNHDNTFCGFNMYRYPDTCTYKSISELPESPDAIFPLLPNHENMPYALQRYLQSPTTYEGKPIAEHVSTEAESTTLPNRDQISCRIDIRSDPADFRGKPVVVNIPPLEGGPTPLAKNENACLYVVLCPSDGGFWPKLTCVLGFLSLFVVDGICSSFFLLDSRVGMAEYLPPGTFTLEHLAVIYLFRYLIGK